MKSTTIINKGHPVYLYILFYFTNLSNKHIVFQLYYIIKETFTHRMKLSYYIIIIPDKNVIVLADFYKVGLNKLPCSLIIWDKLLCSLIVWVLKEYKIVFKIISVQDYWTINTMIDHNKNINAINLIYLQLTRPWQPNYLSKVD